MSAIWMDPTELANEAALLAEQAMHIQETVTGTRTTCSCDVPRSLIAWLDEELLAVTEDALRVAIGYLQEAIDCKTRSNEIVADQSLVTTVDPGSLSAALVADGSVIGGTYFGDGITVMGGATSIVGGTYFGDGITVMGGATATIGGTYFGDGITSMGPTTATIGGAWSNPILDAMRNLQDRNPAAASQLGGLNSMLNNSQSDMISTILAPNGLTFSDGSYVDAGGDRSSSLAGAYRDPYTGKYDLP